MPEEDNGLGELERLTSGETLLIDRRRRGERQGAAAQRLGVTHSMYGKHERDVVELPPIEDLLPLKSYERCLLYRRRCEQTQEQVASELGVCRFWLNQMERGEVACDELISHWEQ